MPPKVLILDVEVPEYLIYENGNLWSNNRNRFLTPHFRPAKDYLGYKVKDRWWGVHQLLAKTFIPNPDNLETVNHKDKNKLNNSLDNLEWMSREDNVKHGLQRVYSLRSPDGVVYTFKGQAEFCREMGLEQRNISAVIRGLRDTCQGWTRV